MKEYSEISGCCRFPRSLTGMETWL